MTTAKVGQRSERPDQVRKPGLDAPGSAGPATVVGVAVGGIAIVAVVVWFTVIGSEKLIEITGITWGFVVGSFVARAGTCLLLMRHALAFPSRSVAVLASAYLLTSVLNLPFQLSFPGNGPNSESLLGGPQTSLWMYFAWNALFSIIIAISSLMNPFRTETLSSARRWLIGSSVAVVLIAAATGGAAIGMSDRLPIVVRLGTAGPSLSSGAFYAAGAVTIALSLLALIATLRRALQGSLLRLWLLIALLLNGGGTVVLMFSENRWTVGWYSSRILGLAGSAVLLLILVGEVIAQSGRLAKTLQQRDELAGIIAAAADGILVVDSAGKITWANRHAEELLRVASGVTGHTITEFVPQDTGNAVLATQQRFAEEPDVRESGSDEVEVVRDDGTSFPADIALRPVATQAGIVTAVAIRDATDRLNREFQLAVARERLLDATEHAPIGHAVSALDGTYTEVNEAFCTIVGYAREEMLGRNFASITHSDDLPGEKLERTAIAEGRSDGYTLVKRYLHSDESAVWIELHVAGIRDRDATLTAFSSQVIDVSARKLAQEQAATALADLSFRATHDPLTGLLNHRESMNKLELALHDQQLGPHPVAIVLCDIDRFKDINDGLGHIIGDDVLAEVGKRFRQRIRETDLVGRVGGDEFVVGLQSVQSIDSAGRAAQDIRAFISDAPIEVAGHSLHLTISVGIALAANGSEAEIVLAQAEAALYRAKINGRNRIEVYDMSMELATARRLEMGSAIHAGLQRGEFHAWFQPIVDLRTKELVGYEALARWVPADGRVIRAADFISVAEETGSILQIGPRVISEALAYLSVLPGHQTMAINTSPLQISGGHFGADLLAMIDSAGISPNRVIVEVTEHAILRLTPSNRSQLEQLCARGVRLDIDDFGTGYSALSHIRELPVTGLKLDRSFTGDLHSMDSAAFRLAQGVALLAASLRLTDVAEGVETEQQAKLLRHAGWTHGQGYLFGAAAPPPDIVGASIPDPRPLEPEPQVAIDHVPQRRRHTDTDNDPFS